MDYRISIYKAALIIGLKRAYVEFHNCIVTKKSFDCIKAVLSKIRTIEAELKKFGWMPAQKPIVLNTKIKGWPPQSIIYIPSNFNNHLYASHRNNSHAAKRKMIRRLREISMEISSGRPPPGLISSQSENALLRRGLLKTSRFDFCEKPYMCYQLTEFGKRLVNLIEN